jgi:hypothetical protein
VHEREVTGFRLTQTLAVDRERRARNEVRLADEVLAPSR